MGLLKKLNDLLERFERFAIELSVMLMAGICIVNVICRNVFNYSLSFGEEVCQFTIVWVTFLGASYAARHGLHIRMSAFYDLLPKGLRKVMMLVMTLGTGLLMFLLTWYACRYVGKMALSGRVSPALRIPMWMIMTWVPLGLASTGIQYMAAAFRNLTSNEVWIAPNVKDGEDSGREYSL
ncbi:MAG: TRAP transporter small permease [Pyramidobacter sp.]|uniref:TRAP transporter small permease n=1 Tax=Pyramidobacter sp. TaxID=1943581 RepID=UPI002A812AE1|nr:TRAP transporter small permease [Pyramidobacter sp.]MDY4033504.1 TRAP transporter small permease [Pyramidobacter sp.]